MENKDEEIHGMDKDGCNIDVNEYPRIHVNPTNTAGNCARGSLTVTKGVHHDRMARN